MWNLRDRAAGARRVWPALAVLLLLAAPGLLPGQEEPPRPAAASPAAAALKDTLERRYEVLPTSGGLLLRPREERLGVRSIEFIGDAIAINGERMPPEAVRAWLQAEAEPLMRLRELAPTERRRLFGFAAEGIVDGSPAGATPEAPDDTDEAGEDGDAEAVGDGAGALPAPPEPPELPEPPEPRRRRATSGTAFTLGSSIVVDATESKERAVAFGGSVRIEGEVLDNAVAFGGSVEIEEGGDVGGNVVSFGDDVVVDGRVGGNVSSMGGDVRLGPTAVVSGDVSSAGGRIERDPGAQVQGNVAAVDGPSASIGFTPFDFLPFNRAWRQVFDALLGLALSGLLLCLVLLVARRPHDRVAARIAADPWRAAGAGLLGMLAFLPLLLLVTLVLVISCIGIPLLLLYPFVFAAILLGALLGLAAVCSVLGQTLEARLGRRLVNPYAVLLLGLVVVMGPEIVARFFFLGDRFLGPLPELLLSISLLIQFAALTTGLGAVILTRFGTPPRAVAVPAPPAPPAPPVEPPPYEPPYEPRPDWSPEPGS